MARSKRITKTKAKTILRDKSVRGKKLTAKQKGFFGLLASGKIPTKIKG